MPYPFELLFNGNKENGNQTPATWQIHIHQEGWADANGTCVITSPKCTEDNIDKEIDNLISRLNDIREEAKERYHAWHEANTRQIPLKFGII